MGADSEGTGGQPNCGNATTGDCAFVIYLPGEEYAAGAATESLVIGKRGGWSRRCVRGGTGAPGPVCKIEPGARMDHFLIKRRVCFDSGTVVGPLQHRTSDRRRAQYPFPIVALDASGRGLTAELIERSKHRFELNADDGGEVRVDADVLLNCGQKAGESYADGVQTWGQAVAVKNSLGI